MSEKSKSEIDQLKTEKEEIAAERSKLREANKILEANVSETSKELKSAREAVDRLSAENQDILAEKETSSIASKDKEQMLTNSLAGSAVSSYMLLIFFTINCYIFGPFFARLKF